MKPIPGPIGGFLNGLEVAAEKAVVDPLRQMFGMQPKYPQSDTPQRADQRPDLVGDLFQALPIPENIKTALLTPSQTAHGPIDVQPLPPSSQPITMDELQSYGIGVQPQVNLSSVSPEAASAFRTFVGGWSGPRLDISSAFRDAAYNRRVGGAKNSQHTHGNAIDLSTSGWTLLQKQEAIRQARAAGFNGIGIYDNSIHLDVRSTPAVWGSDYTRNTAPKWARM